MAGSHSLRVSGGWMEWPGFRQKLIISILDEECRVYEDKIGCEVCLRCDSQQM